MFCSKWAWERRAIGAAVHSVCRPTDSNCIVHTYCKQRNHLKINRSVITKSKYIWVQVNDNNHITQSSAASGTSLLVNEVRGVGLLLYKHNIFVNTHRGSQNSCCWSYGWLAACLPRPHAVSAWCDAVGTIWLDRPIEGCYVTTRALRCFLYS